MNVFSLLKVLRVSGALFIAAYFERLPMQEASVISVIVERNLLYFIFMNIFIVFEICLIHE